eukprot:491940_1
MSANKPTKHRKRYYPTTDDLQLGDEINLKPVGKDVWPLFKVQQSTSDKRKRQNEIYLFDRLPCKKVGGRTIVYALRVKGSKDAWYFPCPVWIPHDTNDGTTYGSDNYYVYAPSCWARQADAANKKQNDINNNNNNKMNDNISIIEDEQDLIEPPSKQRLQSKTTLKHRKDKLSTDPKVLSYESIEKALKLIEPTLRKHGNSKKNKKKHHFVHPEIKDCIHTLDLMES